MGHQLDLMERLRFGLAKRLGRVLTGVESTEVDASEFVGYVEMDEEEFEEELHDMGFHRNPMAYWKKFPGLGDEQGSWRWVEGDWQLHVILFDGHPEDKNAPDDAGPKTYVFAHWEYRWDRYPLKHIRAVEQSNPKGVNRMRTKMNLASIPYYNDPTIQ